MFRGVKIFFSYFFSVAKISCLFLIVFFLPRLFLIYLHTETYAATHKKNRFKLGIENISCKLIRKICSKENNADCLIGLITNQTGKNQYGKRNLDILLQKGLTVKKIFAPEHGIDGTKQAATDIFNSIDKKTNIPIISLYANGKPQPINKDTVKDIDVLVFDMQDCGIRHYTYITTLFESIEAASKLHKKIIVLDRPNILGHCMEGPLVESDFKSAISFAPIPLRYGMTIGELALYYNKYKIEKKADLYVIPMKNYRRNSYPHNKLLTTLSPNIQTMASCYGYSFLGILGEIRPFNTGIGSKQPFQCILLPDEVIFPHENWKELHKILKSYNISSGFYRYFDTRKKKYFSGLKFKITDMFNLYSFNLLIDIIAFFQKSGITIQFSKLFNRAVGTDKIRKFLDGEISNKALQDFINTNLNSFYKKASTCFIYSPFPKIKYANIT